MGNRAISFDTASYRMKHPPRQCDWENGRDKSIHMCHANHKEVWNVNRTNSGEYNDVEETKERATSTPCNETKQDYDDHSYNNIDKEEHDFGWFEDFESPQYALPSNFQRYHNNQKRPLTRALTLPTPVTPPPLYILECSLETQQLWYSTAGRRPKQPLNERAYYEQLWRKNFESSQVHYRDPIESLLAQSSGKNHEIATITAASTSNSIPNMDDSKSGKENFHSNGSIKFTEISSSKKSYQSSGNRSQIARPRDDVIPPSEICGVILTRGRSPFSNSVSRSFLNSDIATLALQMPYFRTIRSCEDGDVHAEFLIIVTLAGSTVPVTLGVWKRHSQFQSFVNYIAEINAYSDYAQNCFKNTLVSWECVLQRKRWFKSLDNEYLTLKCFLLERFLHDCLFETPAPEIITSFLGLSEFDD